MQTEFSAADYRYMARALQLAAKGRYSTHPNPRVGCVLVKNNRIIGEGFHRKAGEPHAERVALAHCSEDPAGATAYVTLEPCSHHGRTPPCADGLIEAGVARVVAAMQDPNPLVAGNGLKRLAGQGIEVQTGLLESAAMALNPGFIKLMQKGLPYVRCKLAASADGRTAMASGESVWITGSAARANVQRLRAEAAAVMTGSGTVVHDNPSMNVRLTQNDLKLDQDLPVRQPLRVILDSSLQTRAEQQILTLPGDSLIFTGHANLHRAADYPATRIIGLDRHHEGLNLRQALEKLADLGINEVLLESGARLAGGMLSAGLIDELIVFQAPHLMGDSARGLLHLPAIENMQQRIELVVSDCRYYGDDLRTIYRIKTQDI